MQNKHQLEENQTPVNHNSALSYPIPLVRKIKHPIINQQRKENPLTDINVGCCSSSGFLWKSESFYLMEVRWTEEWKDDKKGRERNKKVSYKKCVLCLEVYVEMEKEMCGMKKKQREHERAMIMGLVWGIFWFSVFLWSFELPCHLMNYQFLIV